MNDFKQTALSVNVSQAATAVINAALTESRRQATAIMGDRPAPKPAEWPDLSDDDREGTNHEIATSLLQLRIELAVGIDPLGTVLGLRRWGVTWEIIARAAGTSRQSAYGRWGERVRMVLDRYGTGEAGEAIPDDEVDLYPTNAG